LFSTFGVSNQRLRRMTGIQWLLERGRRIRPFGGSHRIGGVLPGVLPEDAVNLDQVQSGVPSDLLMQNTVLSEGKTLTVPASYNAIAFGEYTVNGDLTVDGEFRVVDWPE
jgi:hypothetical protein